MPYINNGRKASSLELALENISKKHGDERCRILTTAENERWSEERLQHELDSLTSSTLREKKLICKRMTV